MEKCSSVVEAIDWRFETGFPIGYLYGPLTGWDGREIACLFSVWMELGWVFLLFNHNMFHQVNLHGMKFLYFALQLATDWSSFISC